MLSKLLSNWRSNLICGGIVLLLVVGLWYGGKHEGRSEQKLTQAAAVAAATIEGNKTHDKVNREVKRLRDPDLDTRLDKWMRD